jgi:hypothetical protein
VTERTNVLNWTNRFLSLFESKGGKGILKQVEQNQKYYTAKAEKGKSITETCVSGKPQTLNS